MLGAAGGASGGAAQREDAIDAAQEGLGGTQHAGDLVSAAVESEGLADNGWIGAQPLRPEVVGEQDGRRRARLVVGVAEEASQDRTGAGEAIEAAGNGGRLHQGGIAAAGESDVITGGEEGQVFEDAIFGAPMLEVDPGDADAGGASRGFAEPD